MSCSVADGISRRDLIAWSVACIVVYMEKRKVIDKRELLFAITQSKKNIDKESMEEHEESISKRKRNTKQTKYEANEHEFSSHRVNGLCVRLI
jgi:hypothetical protein